MTNRHREDARHRLDETPFDYRATKDGRVLISWQGKQIIILKGEAARTFLAKIEGCDEHEAQLVMAKATGHFKHGNERSPNKEKL